MHKFKIFFGGDIQKRGSFDFIKLHRLGKSVEVIHTEKHIAVFLSLPEVVNSGIYYYPTNPGFQISFGGKFLEVVEYFEERDTQYLLRVFSISDVSFGNS